jgi:hypothetical protein
MAQIFIGTGFYQSATGKLPSLPGARVCAPDDSRYFGAWAKIGRLGDDKRMPNATLKSRRPKVPTESIEISAMKLH